MTEKEMPKYQCFKQVHALKIARVDRNDDGSAKITPADEGYAPFVAKVGYMQKHDPQVGGYYVVYPDGYQSFSPSKAFEDGYRRI